MPDFTVTGTNNPRKQISKDRWNEFVAYVDTKGASAFEIWQSLPGNEGKTVEEWLASLKGADGNEGDIIGLFTAAEARDIPESVESVRTEGFSAVGDAGGATFTTATTGSPYAVTFTAADSRVFELDVSHGISLRAFGAGPWKTASQNFAAIQKALDHMIWMNHAKGLDIPVETGAGVYDVNDALLMARISGGAYAFFQGTMRGPAGKGYLASKATIRQTNKDLPALIIQGARGVEIRNLAFVGGANTQAQPSMPQILNDDTGTPWWNTEGARDSRYSPHAGICVDPYATNLPPDGGYPGKEAFYIGYAGSSIITFDNVDVRGFIVGFMLSAHHQLQNNDSVTLRDCNYSYNKVGIAIGQSQCRGINIENPHTIGNRIFVDCISYGQGNGPGPTVTGGVLVHLKYLYAGAESQSGTATFTGTYCEQMWSIGFTNGALPTAFINCNFAFAGEFDFGDGKFPMADAHLMANGPVMFKGGTLRFYQPYTLGVTTNPNLYIYAGRKVSFEGTTFEVPPIANEPDNVTFVDCPVSNELGGFLGGMSDVFRFSNPGLVALGEGVPAYTTTGGSIFEGRGSDYRHWRNLNAFERIQLGGFTTVTAGDGVATFELSDPGAVKVGDVIIAYAEWAMSKPVAHATGLVGRNMPIGRVHSIVGNAITLRGVPPSYGGGSNILYVARYTRAKVRTRGTITSGSATIASASPTAFWRVGERIKGVGIPPGSHIISKTSDTITISQNATASGTVDLYDADLSLEEGFATAPPTTGVWFRGDFLKAYGGSALDLNEQVLNGWICTKSGEPGDWHPVYTLTTSPVPAEDPDNLLVNGRFNDGTGWGLTAGWEIVSGKLVANSTTGANTASGALKSDVESGKTYRLTGDIINTSETLGFFSVGGVNSNFPTTGPIDITFEATATTDTMVVYAWTDGWIGTLDNLLLKEVV
jgi:hypothetical protein